MTCVSLTPVALRHRLTFKTQNAQELVWLISPSALLSPFLEATSAWKKSFLLVDEFCYGPE